MSEEATAAEGAAPRSKKGLILIGAALVLAGGGAGAWFMLGGKDEGTAEQAAVQEVKLPAQFVALDPPFVVNFQPGASARFLQVAVQLMTRDPALAASIGHLTPIIRNDLLLLFGNKQVEEVSTPEGKEALRLATLEAVRRIIASEGGNAEALEAVYFTSFVMQ